MLQNHNRFILAHHQLGLKILYNSDMLKIRHIQAAETYTQYGGLIIAAKRVAAALTWQHSCQRRLHNNLVKQNATVFKQNKTLVVVVC